MTAGRDKANGTGPDSREARAARLSKALRENLKRRKAAQRRESDKPADRDA
jgi:hypothetical protein